MLTEAVEMPEYPGYRVDPEASVFSCLAFKGAGRGKAGSWYQSTNWRPLRPDRSARKRPRFRLRNAAGKYETVAGDDLVKKYFPNLTKEPANGQESIPVAPTTVTDDLRPPGV